MTGTQILRIRTKFTAFPVSPARKLSGCDPHFRPSYGVARCADLRGPRAAGGNSVWCSRICQFCAPGYSVGRARAEFAERIRKSHRIREHSEFTAHLSPIRYATTDRFTQNRTSEMKNRLQYTYHTSMERSRRALSIDVPCISSRAHSASISPDHFSAAPC